MLTIENIYNSRTLERHSDGIFVNNQRLFVLAPINDGKEYPEYYAGVTGYSLNGQSVAVEKVIMHKHKKIRVSMIALRNDSQWS